MGKVQIIIKSYTHEGLIDETFSYDYTQEQGFGFAMIGGDTPKPDKLAETIEKHVIDSKTGRQFY